MKHQREHHADYARIAQLERELGLEGSVLAPLPESIMRTIRPALPPPATPVRAISRPDNVCANCIPGRTPAHSCPFWPECQQ